jgi:L-methionine (R)-S-oxide reductase
MCLLGMVLLLLTRRYLSNLSNAASLLYHGYQSLPLPSSAVNWAGFYVVYPNDPTLLVLGPFQGHVACQSIRFGKGVCGTAAAEKEAKIIPNVDRFPGHISCDSKSRSEIVVPIVVNDQVNAPNKRVYRH